MKLTKDMRNYAEKMYNKKITEIRIAKIKALKEKAEIELVELKVEAEKFLQSFKEAKEKVKEMGVLMLTCNKYSFESSLEVYFSPSLPYEDDELIRLKFFAELSGDNISEIDGMLEKYFGE